MSGKWLLRLAPFGPGALLGVCFIAAAWSSVGAASAPVQPGAAPPAPDAESSLKPFPTGGPRPELVVQNGHSQGFSGTAIFSPDGRRLATTSHTLSGAGEAILWEAATGRQIRTFVGSETSVGGLAFSPDGRRLLAGTAGREALIWDVATGQILHRLPHKDFNVSDVAFSPDGRHAATTNGKEAILWDADTGRPLRTFGPHGDGVAGVHFSPGHGDQLLTRVYGYSRKPGEVHLWDVATGKEIHRLGPFPGSVHGASFSPDGSKVVTLAQGGKEKRVAVWNAETAARVCEFAEYPDATSAVFVEGGAKVATTWFSYSDDSDTIISYDATTGKELNRRPGNLNTVSDDGRLTLTFDKKGDVGTIRSGTSGAVVSTIRCLAEEPVSVTPSRDGQQLLVGFQMNFRPAPYEVLWDLASGRLMRSFNAARKEEGPEQNVDVQAPTWTPEDEAAHRAFLSGFDAGQRRVLAFHDKRLELRDSQSGKVIQSFPFYPTDPKALTEVQGVTALIDGGRKVFKGDVLLFGWHPPQPYDPQRAKHFMRWTIWDVATGREDHHIYQEVPDGVAGMAVSPDGARVALGMADGGLFRLPSGEVQRRDGTVVIRDAATGAEVQRFKVAGHRAVRMAFNAGGHLLLESGEDDSAATLYTVADGEVAAKLDGHAQAITAFAFTPDGERILTSSKDGTTRVWNAATGKEWLRLMSFNEGREWLAVTAQGYFDGSIEGRRRVCWRIENEAFPLELYEKRFYRPDLVSLAVRGLTTDETAAVPGSHKPPRVRLETEKVESDSVTIRATATAGSKEARVASLRVLVDGRDLASEQAQGIAIEKAAGPQAIFRGKVNFPPGKATAVVAAVASDEFGLRSDPAVVQIVRAGPTEAVKRNLYVLAVGVSNYQNSQFNLRFAAADAQALTKELGRQEGRAFEAVHARVLVDGDATLPNIREALVWLAKGCGPADVAVVLFSGHGARSSRGELFYVPYEADDENTRATFLRWDEIDKGLRLIRASSVLFLSDCCHAGAFGERAASQDDLAYPLLTNARVMVFAASRGRESSIEKAELSHGAFTYAVLRGLTGEADLIKDGRVTISELQTYVANQVKVLTGDRQHPHIPRMNDFDPETVIAYVK